MVGMAVFCGAVARRWIVLVSAEASPTPSELRAVTTTSSRLPRSASPSRYVRVRSMTPEQLAIRVLHRTHL
jgi:hypothetical protein